MIKGLLYLIERTHRSMAIFFSCLPIREKLGRMALSSLHIAWIISSEKRRRERNSLHLDALVHKLSDRSSLSGRDNEDGMYSHRLKILLHQNKFNLD